MHRSSHLSGADVRQVVKWILLGGAMLVTVATGLALPSTARADACGALALHDGMSATARSIALLEGQDPANCPTGATVGFVPMPPNQRSIQLVESKAAPGGILAGVPAPPRRVAYEDSEHAVTQNRDGTAHLAPQPTSPHGAAF